VGVKRPVHDADNSPPSSAKVMNKRSYTCTPQYVFMAWCLIKGRIRFMVWYFGQNVTSTMASGGHGIPHEQNYDRRRGSSATIIYVPK